MNDNRVKFNRRIWVRFECRSLKHDVIWPTSPTICPTFNSRYHHATWWCSKIYILNLKNYILYLKNIFLPSFRAWGALIWAILNFGHFQILRGWQIRVSFGSFFRFWSWKNCIRFCRKRTKIVYLTVEIRLAFSTKRWWCHFFRRSSSSSVSICFPFPFKGFFV